MAFILRLFWSMATAVGCAFPRLGRARLPRLGPGGVKGRKSANAAFRPSYHWPWQLASLLFQWIRSRFRKRHLEPYSNGDTLCWGMRGTL
jgi:hypothetical protein